jgi:hypothetical protein
MCHHSIRFYAEAFPAAEVSDFIAEGVLEGDACVLILARPHRQAVQRHLAARGIGASTTGRHAGAYSVIDTHEALSLVIHGDRLDLDLASNFLQGMLSAASASRRLRAAGDLAPTLFAAENLEDALAFEALAHHEAAVHSAAILCTYPLQHFCLDGSTDALLRMCAHHSASCFPSNCGFTATWPQRKPATRDNTRGTEPGGRCGAFARALKPEAAPL